MPFAWSVIINAAIMPPIFLIARAASSGFQPTLR